MKTQPSKQVLKHKPPFPEGNPTQLHASTATPAPMKPPMFNDLHARITARADELYLERGCREGCAEQDWLDAEREILNMAFPT